MKKLTSHVLTPSQKKVLDLIKLCLKNEGYAPTVREMALELGFKSPRAIAYHLEQLVHKGYIKKTDDGSRNIALQNIENQNKSFFVPLVGWSAGGRPIYAEENIIDWIAISPQFVKQDSDIFLLSVQGNSMSPKIENGDMVIVKRQLVAQPGEIIVALIGDETTIKKYLPQQGQIVLQPTNPEYEPLVVKPNRLRIQGIVRGVMKKLK